jgi:hypothetical protein
MATYYIDLVNGNDSADGSTFALGGLPTVGPWLTITNGATAARIAAGDEIRISKTDEPTSLGMTATWTNLSQDVTLNSALTAEISKAQTGWTAATNVTASTSTTRKFGSTAVSLAIADAFTTGKVGYVSFTSKDLSAYQQVSLWFRTSTAQAASVFSIKLCSDTTGDTAVNTINMPATGAATYHCVTVDTGGALGSAIQSVALYANSDPGTVTCLVNNIIACKAPGNDALTLRSLIGKSSAVGSDWYCIQSIDGATIKVDSASNSAAGRGYFGTTETVTTYKREGFELSTTTNSTTNIGLVNDTGTVNANITYSGGWNTSNTTRDGETFFDGVNFWGYLFGSGSSKNYILIKYFGFVRYSAILTVNGGPSYVENCLLSNSNQAFVIGRIELIKNSYILNMAATTNMSQDFIKLDSCTISNCSCGISSNSFSLKNCSLNNNTYGIDITGYCKLYIYNTSFSNNSTADVEFDSFDSTLYSFNEDNTAGNNWIYYYQGTANWQTTTKQGSDPGSWQLIPSTTRSGSIAPLKFKVAEVAVVASSSVTITAWVKKDHATNVGAKLVVYANTVVGPSTDQTDSKADDTNWEQLSISFTPTVAGVVPVYVEAWYSAGASNVYVGSVTVTQ